MWSQVSLRKHHYKQSQWRWWNSSCTLSNPKDDAVKVLHSVSEWVKVTQSCLTLWDSMDCPWNSPGQNTGVGSLSLLQGIFLTRDRTQVSHIAGGFFYQLSHKGSPRILVAYPFSNGSSQSRNQTGVSCIAGGFFTNWAIREAGDLGSIPGLGRSPEEGNMHIRS